MHVTLVTITNRSRWNLLSQTLQAAFDGAVDRAVIIDNESEEDIAGHVSRSFPDRCTTFRFNRNQGSAGAYREGIRRALEEQAEYLLLLDDDNAIRPETLPRLKASYQQLLDESSKDRLCLSAFRAAQEALRGEAPEPHFPDAHTFLGFHVKDAPIRILKRLKFSKNDDAPRVPPIPSGLVRREIAPWGGLFFHRALIERFGYPDHRFVLYGDDVEFTHRIASKGGELWLDPEAKIDDIDVSWLSERSGNVVYFVAWIVRGSDEQVYFHIRNMAYLETCGRPFSPMRRVNRFVLLPVLWMIAAFSGRTARFKLVRRAVIDGERGRFANSFRPDPL